MVRGIPRSHSPAQPAADAQRNYDRLLSAGRTAVDERRPSIVLEDIAKDAGVVIGTLYNHFPTHWTTAHAAMHEAGTVLLCRAQAAGQVRPGLNWSPFSA
jgi:hypothetical protein